MTRYKTELRKHGIKLEMDYPYLPYTERGSQIAVEGVRTCIDENIICVFVATVVGISVIHYDRNFSPKYVDLL